jgi:hypothetical protein
MDLGHHTRSPPSDQMTSMSKRPRLSTITSGKVATPPPHPPQVTRLDDLFSPKVSGPKLAADESYTIPQLRGLSLEDDPSADDEDTCEACFDTANLRSMKRLTPCHVSCHSSMSTQLTDSTTSAVDVSVRLWEVYRKITRLRAARNA